MRLLPYSWLICIWIITSCGAPSREWTDIDWTVWKNDKGGCLQQRLPFLESLRTQKEKLKGLSEMEIISLLGKPDQNELYKRNQKFYYYWIGPGDHCTQAPATSPRLSIRFNAVGKAKEVAID